MNNREITSTKLIGEGSYGSVFLVELENGEQYILKEIQYDTSKERKLIQTEIDILTKIKPNCREYLVCIKEAKITDSKGIIFMEFIPYTITLKTFLKENQHMNIGQKFSIIFYLTEAINELHLLGVVHRDIKLSNILINDAKNDNEYLHCHLIDYGLACDEKDAECLNHKHRGTTIYMAPELFDEKQPLDFDDNKKIDIWALGMTFVQIVFEYEFWYKYNINEVKKLLKDIHQSKIDQILNRTIERYQNHYINNMDLTGMQRVSDETEFFISIITPMLMVDIEKRMNSTQLYFLLLQKREELVKLSEPKKKGEKDKSREKPSEKINREISKLSTSFLSSTKSKHI